MTRRPADASADRIGRLYDRLGGVLYRHALMILADPAAAADAVHDVFVAVLGRDVVMDEAERYLHRAVRNECYSVLRRRRRARTGAADALLLESVAGQPDRPDERLAVEQAIRALPPEQRE